MSFLVYENGVAVLVTPKAKSVILYRKSPFVDGKVVFRKERSDDSRNENSKRNAKGT